MDKKGITVKYLLTALVAVVILAVLVWAAVSLQGGQNNTFLNSLLNFGDDIENVKEIAVLRYNLDENVVQFYDGESWHGFQEAGEVELDGKVIEYGNVTKAFGVLYFSGGENKEVSLSSNIFENIYYGSCSKVPRGPGPDSFTTWIARTGLIFPDSKEVRIDLISSFAGKETGESFFVLTSSDDLEFQKVSDAQIPCLDGSLSKLDRSTIGEDYDKVVDLGKSWRASASEGPIDIPLKNGNEITIDCIKKDGKYLIVDLNKPKEYCED